MKYVPAVSMESKLFRMRILSRSVYNQALELDWAGHAAFRKPVFDR